MTNFRFYIAVSQSSICAARTSPTLPVKACRTRRTSPWIGWTNGCRTRSTPEYANGPVDSVWGGLRARNGHPAPFHLKYLEIGNENDRAAYRERWPLFVKAIKAKYPDIHLIANQWEGTYPTEPMPRIVDEHYYDTPDWFIHNVEKYDASDHNGPKISSANTPSRKTPAPETSVAPSAKPRG